MDKFEEITCPECKGAKKEAIACASDPTDVDFEACWLCAGTGKVSHRTVDEYHMNARTHKLLQELDERIEKIKQCAHDLRKMFKEL